jgi:hypothetical protein
MDCNKPHRLLQDDWVQVNQLIVRCQFMPKMLLGLLSFGEGDGPNPSSPVETREQLNRRIGANPRRITTPWVGEGSNPG